MIQIFTIHLAANESREVALSGEYFELRNAPFPVYLIELLDRSGGMVSRIQNPDESDYVRPGLFETIRVSNGPTAQTVKYFVGSGDAGSRRTAGNVYVIDGEKNNVIKGQAYSNVLYQGPTGERPYSQIFNPANSGKNLIFSHFSNSVTDSAGVNIYIDQIEFATATYPNAKKMPVGPASVARARVKTAAVEPAVPFGVLWGHFLQAFDQVTWTPNPVVIVPPGYAINSYVANDITSLKAIYEWTEEPI